MFEKIYYPPFDNGEAMEGLELIIEEYGDSAYKQQVF
jgi:hypothetical protein